MNENVDAVRIVEVLNRHLVVYVIVGGYAAELHAVADLPPTRDVDVCPATDRENLGRLSAALTELHALVPPMRSTVVCRSLTIPSRWLGRRRGTWCATPASWTSRLSRPPEGTNISQCMRSRSTCSDTRCRLRPSMT